MKKLYQIILLLLLLTPTKNLFAQPGVDLEVIILEVQRTGYGDCFGCGSPDPAWIIDGYLNGVDVGTSTLTYENMSGQNWYIGYNGCDGPSNCNVVNTPYTTATNFVIGLTGWENDCDPMDQFNSSCGIFGVNSDDRYCTDSNVRSVNFRTFAPCTWHDSNTQWTDWCGNYRVRYAFRWEFKQAPTINVQPVSNTSLCLGDTPTTLAVATNDDGYGNNLGRFFQWQVSENTACSGAANWQDIPGANSSTYTPPEIAGTRLYRCKATSNCTALFGSYTTTSNCARVSYNPMDGATSNAPAGFPYGSANSAPDIQSGICGSTVLPGTTHTFGTLLPPAVGAITNINSYSWSASAGTITPSITGETAEWVAPTAPGTYNIILTYNDNCSAGNQSVVCQVDVGSPSCEFIYVSPSGSNNVNCGGPNNPCANLSGANGAMAKVTSGRNHIKMENGNYTETSIIELQDNMIIEGGYIETGGIWSKSSNSLLTNITCSGTSTVTADNSVSVQQIIAFRGSDDDNWKLIDLDVNTTNASGTHNGRGISNYGLRLWGCTGWEIIRCEISSGNASAGANGTGLGDGGSNGYTGYGGNNGSCDGGHGDYTGTRFGPGAGTREGGDGGRGGRGGYEGPNNGVSGSLGSNGGGGASRDLGAGGGGGHSNCDGGNGGSASGCTGCVGGSAGSPGSGYSAGNRPTDYAYASYFVPGAKAANGGDGGGGGGGAGGGGGGGQGETATFAVCNDGGGNGGGSGGTGGEGGQGGAGAYGGGATFGMYLYNGSSGNVINSVITSANRGTGGSGQAGGSGGSGGNGGSGASVCTGEVGRGGNGSRGGNGAAGGRGRDGANGIDLPFYNVTTGSSSNPSSSVPNSPIVDINYKNAKICRNSILEIEKSTGTWTLPSGFSYVNDEDVSVSSYGNTSSPALIYPTVTNVDRDLIASFTTFNSYLQVSADARTAPSITDVTEICIYETLDLSASSTWGTEVEYLWEIFPANSATGPPIWTSTLQSPTTNAFITAGTYTIRYQVREECCGWSIYAFDKFIVNPVITSNNLENGPIEACTTDNPILIEEEVSLTGGNGIYTYAWEYSTDLTNYTACSGLTSTAAEINVAHESLPSGTYYFRRNVFSGGCDAVSDISVVKLLDPSTDPTSLSATITEACVEATVDFTITGGSLGDEALWHLYAGDPDAGGLLVRTGDESADFDNIVVTSTTTFYIRAEGGCNVTNSATVTITINSESTDPVVLDASPNPFCDMSNVTLTVSGGSLGTGAEWYLYNTDPTVGSPVALDNNPSGVFTVNGVSTTTTFYVRAEGTCNTTNAVNVEVTVNDSPVNTATMTASPNSACLSASVTFDIDPGWDLGTDGQFVLYNGTPGGAGVVGFNVASFPYLLPFGVTTTTTFNLRIESALCGNTSSVTATVTIDEDSPAANDPNIMVCTTDATSYDLTALNSTVNPAATITWYDGDPNGAGSALATPAATDLHGLDVWALVDDGGLCTSTLQVSVTIDLTIPTATDPNIAVCTADAGSYDVTQHDGVVNGGATITWYDGNPGSGGTAIASPTTTDLTSVDLWASVDDGGLCTNTVEATVTINTAPGNTPFVVNATPANSCGATSVTLDILGTLTGTNAQWVLYNGDPDAGGTQLDMTTGTSFITTASSTTTYYVRAEGTCGNSNSANTTVTIDTDTPTGTDPNIIVCNTDATSYDVTQHNATVNATATVTWYDGDPDAGGTAIASPTTTDLTSVDLWASVDDGGLCTATLDVTVTIDMTSPATTDPNVMVCNTDATSYDLTQHDATVNATATVTWYDGEPGNGGTAIASPTTADLTTVDAWALVEDGEPCSSTLDITVSIDTDLPTATDPAILVCGTAATSYDVTQHDASVNATATITWYDGDPGSGGTAIASPTTTDLTSVDLWASVDDGGSCTAAVDATVTLDAESTAATSLTVSPTPYCGTSDVDVTVNGGSLGTGASWYLFDSDPTVGGTVPPPYAGSALQSSALANPTFTVVGVSATTTFYVLAEGNCNSTTATTGDVVVHPDPVNPAIMTASPSTSCLPTPVTFNIPPVGWDLGTDGQFVLYNGTPGDPGVIGLNVASFPYNFPFNVTTTTTFRLRIESALCGNTAFVDAIVQIETSSTDPTSISATPYVGCASGSSTISVSGGTLGSGAEWYLYDSDPTFGTPTVLDNNASGSFLVSGLTTETTFYIRAEGSCGATAYQSTTITPQCDIILTSKVFLKAAYNAGTGLMNDQLRAGGLIPLEEPYTAIPQFTHVNGGGGEMTTQLVLDVTGNDAIVDWVFVELRDKSNSSAVIATRSALVQRDGDVVDVDGVSDVIFTGVAADDYYVAIRHRNHLGAMSIAAEAISAAPNMQDFTDATYPTHGTNAQYITGAVAMLWMGNVNTDTNLNIIDNILAKLNTNPSVSGTYSNFDANMDGNLNVIDNILVKLNTNPSRQQQIP